MNVTLYVELRAQTCILYLAYVSRIIGWLYTYTPYVTRH